MEDLDLYEWVPAFSGDQSLSLDVYFQRVHSYCIFYDLGPRKELLLAEHRCVGAAATALTGKSFNSLSELRSRLEAVFNRSEEDAFATFTQVKQDLREPVSAYADRLRLSFERTSVSGAVYLLRQAFLLGLQPSLQQQVVQLAPDSFEEALAKAKVFEADTCPAPTLVASGWPGPSQEPSGSHPRQSHASKRAQRTQSTRDRHLSPAAQTAEPQLSCHMHAADFSTELINTTELLQDLLQSCEASQGSPVLGDPTAACQLFQLVDPPAAAARPLSLLEAVASPLRSFLDRAAHHGDLPAAVLTQLEHCQTILHSLESALTQSDSTLPDAPLHQAPVEPHHAEQHLSYQALTARNTPSSPPEFDLSPGQPAPQLYSPPSFRLSHSSAFVPVGRAWSPQQLALPLPLGLQIADCRSVDSIHAGLPSDTAAAILSEAIAPCVIETSDSYTCMPGEASAVQRLDIHSPTSDHSQSMSHASAQPLASEHCYNLDMSPLPGAAAKHLPTTSMSSHMPCEQSLPAGHACPTGSPSAAAPTALIKAGRGPKMRQKPDTAASLMIAGSSLGDTSPSSAPLPASDMTDLPTDIYINSAQIPDPHQPSKETTFQPNSYLMFDPGGPLTRHGVTAQGDLVTSDRPTSAAHTLMPGTGITLVQGRGHEYVIDCFDTFSLPSVPFHGLTSSAFIVSLPYVRLILPVSAFLQYSSLPSFTELPDPG